MDYISREMEEKVKRMSSSFKAILLTGSRQCGKTTMLKHIMSREMNYVSLDDTDEVKKAKEDPKLFFMEHKTPLFIDEVQKAPELFPFIKIICDNSDQKGLFFLTGSESFSLLDKARESLAGRVCILKLEPLSYREINNTSFSSPLSFDYNTLKEREKEAPSPSLDSIFSYIWKGGFPGIINESNEVHKEFHNSYLNTYLMRDITMDGKVKDYGKFIKFLSLCAGSVGSLINISNLSSLSGISSPTGEYYLHLLESANIIYLLHPLTTNGFKRIVKAPKLYFTSPSLAAFLTKWLSKDTLLLGREAGSYFENFVINEIRSSLFCGKEDFSLYFYRDSNGKEIDLVLEKDGVYNPLEIVLSSSPDKNIIKSFSVLDNFPIKRSNGGVICMSENVKYIDENNFIIPCTLF